MKRLCTLSLLGLLLALAVARPTPCAASGFLVTHWRSEEGLPHSVVNSIVQTHDGYLWVGTYVGLVRFDGARFVYFSPREMPELGNGRISKLFEDRSGTLWIGLESGRLLAWKEGVIRTHFPGGPREDAVVAMAQDGAGTVWLQNAAGNLGRVTSEGIDLVARTGFVPNRASLGLVIDGQDRLWVGTSEGVKLWQDNSLATAPGIDTRSHRPMDALARAVDGGIWVCRSGHVKKIHGTEVVLDYEIPRGLHSSIVELLESASGNLWVAAQDGSLWYLTPAGLWQPIPEDSGLRGPSKALFEDREGNLWRGSFGGGLSRLRPQFFTVHLLPAPSLDRYALSLCADAGGSVWSLLNNHALALIPPGSNQPEVWAGPEVPRAIRTLLTTRRNELWLGTDGGYLFRLHDGAFAEVLRVDRKAEAITAMFEDTHSNLWVGFTQGAGLGVLPQGDPSQYHTVPGVTFPDVRAIAQAADGAMWFGTHYGGADRLKAGVWTHFTAQDGLPSDYVRCLHADAEGTMWLGTIRGLACWRNGKFTAIKTENGLWNDSISHIAEDGRGRLWMSSFGGIFRVSRQDLLDFADGRRTSVQCVGYNRNDGLPSQECPGGFQPAGARTPDGRLWFPTVGGVVSIAPDQLPENTVPPPVWVEEVLVDGTPHRLQQSSPNLVVPPGGHRLEFHFTALSFPAPEKIRFRHQLVGLEPDWSNSDSRRTAVYNVVPPGHYTFCVMACNNDGLWNTTATSLAVVVRPFFWQTWWFKGALALALASALAAGIQWAERKRTRLRLERLEREHAVERERARIARDIHDDLGASLTQISILSDRIADKNADPPEAERCNQRIATVARHTIQSLNEIVWAVSPKDDTLESLANYLNQFAHEHLTLAGVRAVLDIPTVLPSLPVSAEVRHDLLLAAREALQNAVAHAGASTIRVALALTDEALEITVSDDGRGFVPDPDGDGKGLTNLQRRLEEAGGRFELKTSPGQGTTVRLWMPRDRLHVRGIGKPPPDDSL